MLNGLFGGRTIVSDKIKITTSWYFQDLIRRNVYTRIDYKFLIAGHTYGSTDQTFDMIEHYASRIVTVYTPKQWYQHVRDAGASIWVVEMNQHFF